MYRQHPCFLHRQSINIKAACMFLYSLSMIFYPKAKVEYAVTVLSVRLSICLSHEYVVWQHVSAKHVGYISTLYHLISRRFSYLILNIVMQFQQGHPELPVALIRRGMKKWQYLTNIWLHCGKNMDIGRMKR